MAAVTNVTEQLFVTGFADHNFGQVYYEQSSDAQDSLPGLDWRLRARVHVPDGMLHPTLLINFEDSEPNTVYSAKVKLSVLLPNGQLVAEREDRVRHRFQDAQFYINGDTNPELNNFIGQQGQLLCESFIFKADIEVHGEPTILRSPCFDHAIGLDTLRGSWSGCCGELFVAGYQHCSRRLVFWLVTERFVRCMAVNPLVPSSLVQLGQHRNHCTLTGGDDFLSRAALSYDQHLAACVTRCYGCSYNFYVLLLDTNTVIHRRYIIQNQEEHHVSFLQGLAHTRRGWIIWTATRRFYRLENEMELVLRVQEALIHTVRLAANYNWLLVTDLNEDKIQIWDLGSSKSFDHLSSKSFEHHQLDSDHWLMGHRDEVFALEGSGVLSRIEFEGDECRAQLCYRLHRGLEILYALDQGKLVLVDMQQEEEPRVETVWMPGQIPTAKEMATIEIQKRTGTQEVMQTATGEKSVWKGGLTEEKITKILRVFIKPRPYIMN